WRSQNPNAPISEWFGMQPSMYQSDKRPFPNQPTTIKTTEGSVQGSYNPNTGKYVDASGTVIPPERITGANKVGVSDQLQKLRDRLEEAYVTGKINKRQFDQRIAEMGIPGMPPPTTNPKMAPTAPPGLSKAASDYLSGR